MQARDQSLSISGHSIRMCPLCGCDNRSQPVHPNSRDLWRLKTCTGCHFVYLENAPEYESLDGDHEWSATFSAEKLRRRADEPVLHHIHVPFRRWCKKLFRRNKFLHLATEFIFPGRVLDVGCGSGRRLADLPRSYTPFGIEISQRLACQADYIFSSRGGRLTMARRSSGSLRLSPTNSGAS